MQLENGVRAVLIYDPKRDDFSSYHRAATRELRDCAPGGEWAGELESDGDATASLGICVRTGSFSDPQELQVRPPACPTPSRRTPLPPLPCLELAANRRTGARAAVHAHTPPRRWAQRALGGHPLHAV